MDRYAVVGNPIEHSKSPLIHAMFAEQTGQQLEYGKLLAPLDNFIGSVRDFLREGRGVNVTVPFKEQAWALVDEHTPAAERAGAVNTILRREDGSLLGDNTDGKGLVRDIEINAGLSLKGLSVLLVGAGGAARAAVHALGQVFAEVRIINRTPARAEALIAAVQPHSPALLVHRDAVTDAALIVNALSVPPELDLTTLAPDAVLMDMTYRPLMTGFLRAGAERGHTVVDGLAMLIGQAQPSFATLFGVAPPDMDVRAEALRVLGGRA